MAAKSGAPRSSERSPNGAAAPDKIVSAGQHIVHPVGSQRLDGLAQYCQLWASPPRSDACFGSSWCRLHANQEPNQKGLDGPALLQPPTSAADITHPATGNDTRPVSTILASGASKANPAEDVEGLSGAGPTVRIVVAVVGHRRRTTQLRPRTRLERHRYPPAPGRSTPALHTRAQYPPADSPGTSGHPQIRMLVVASDHASRDALSHRPTSCSPARHTASGLVQLVGLEIALGGAGVDMKGSPLGVCWSLMGFHRARRAGLAPVCA